MKLAIQGCSHGELDAIYASLLRIEREQSLQIDALLLCGDFQAIRNHSDLHALNAPPKYLHLGDFHSYYSGEKVAPVLTLVIGGNHEASNYMHELYHGGWLAPNIYFLGAAGVVELNGLVVMGISGIYNGRNYKRGRFEKLPYDASSVRSCYHTREFDVNRLKAMKGKQVDIAMSHDWPNTIERWGDQEWLIQKKPWFKDDIASESLGNPPYMELLQCLKPTFWFAAHLHVRFAAIFRHDSQSNEAAPATTSTGDANPEALDIGLDSDDDEQPASSSPTVAKSESEPQPAATPNLTRFLALHKCLSHSPFLQIIDHPSPHDADLESRKSALNYTQRIPPTFRYNKRWLAITRASHPYLSLQYGQPELLDSFLAQVDEEERWIEENVLSAARRNSGKRKQDELEGSRVATPVEDGDEVLDVHRVQQFVRTAPAPFEPGGLNTGPPAWYTNPQTEAFCRFIGVENKINPRPKGFPPVHPHQFPAQQLPAAEAQAAGATPSESIPADPNALAIDMDDLDSGPEDATQTTQAQDKAEVLKLSDDENELHARWKEGTG